LSGYAIQLREKQKAKLIYGLLERQFRKYFEEAFGQKGNTGELLIQILERRLDNAVYRLGLATTRAQARQLVSHGHMTVNGRVVDIPSFRVKAGDVIAPRSQSVAKTYFTLAQKTLENHTPPAWVDLEKSTMTGKVLALPTRQDVELNLNPQLIVEFYSR